MAINRLKSYLFSPVDGSFLAVFRIGFGIIMFWEVLRYWFNDWIYWLYIRPTFYFKYYGFEWEGKHRHPGKKGVRSCLLPQASVSKKGGEE